MTWIIEAFSETVVALDTHWVAIVASLQAAFCGGCAYQIGFKYFRGESKYSFRLSLCAAGLGSLMAQQWLSIVGRVLMYGEWPVVSIYNTLVFAIIFFLLMQSKGNVAKMFDFSSHGGGGSATQ
uniref:Holin n=1 Tax=Pseudomonas phage Orisa03 TaxID=3138542 RepID=A0AAU6W362_9VIRU